MTTTIQITNGHVDGYLTILEFAKKIYVDKRTVRAWIRRGKVHPLRIGYQIFIPETQGYPEEKRGTRGKKRNIVGLYCEEERMMVFCERLDQVLREKDLSETDLADMADILPQSVSRYISGKSVPSLLTTIKIAEALDVSLDWLCGIDRNGQDLRSEEQWMDRNGGNEHGEDGYFENY